MQAKAFFANTPVEIEEKINKWLKRTRGIVVREAAFQLDGTEYAYNVLVFYEVSGK